MLTSCQLMAINLIVFASKIEKWTFASEALSSIMRELNHLDFELLIVESDLFLEKLTDCLLEKVDLPLEVRKIKSMKEFVYVYGVSYILLSRKEIIYNCPTDEGQFKNLQNIERRTNTYRESIFLNYIYGITSKQLERYKYSGNYRHFQLVHSPNDSLLLLYNFVMFAENSCDKEWIPVNSFEKVKLQWKIKSKFIQKFKNFNRCKITFFVHHDDMPTNQILHFKDKDMEKFLFQA